MGVGLQPLEFSDCLADSPAFRENLLRHEKELERTSQQIKRLIKEVKDVVSAAKRLGEAQLALADSMQQFEFACIGASMTEDERVISRSLAHFAQLVRTIEEERGRMLGRAHEQIIEPLERFRKEHIGAVKESKKKFDKKTAKFCQSQERTLALAARKPDIVFQEADAALEMAERDLCQASVEYVFQLQGLQERKKFELVETLLGFVLGWWTFYHTAHDVHLDAEPRVKDLQLRIQRTRSNFEETSKQTQSLMNKMMEMRQLNKDEEGCDESGAKAGYLFMLEKKAFGAAWSKQWAAYAPAGGGGAGAGGGTLALLGFSQTAAAGKGGAEAVRVRGARGLPDAERRHCWEALPADPDRPPLQLQALSAGGRGAWVRALQGAEGGARAGGAPGPAAAAPAPALDDAGFSFVTRIISTLEARGLAEQGLYRVAGVSSKVARLLRGASCPSLLPASLEDPCQWESRTLTSALKAYLRGLSEPLATRRLHQPLLDAAKRESRAERVSAVHALVHALPHRNFDMLNLVIRHLCNVAAASERNLMSASNLAVCFGPTLLRAERETVASILELKFYNVLVETLLDHYATIFLSPPPAAPAPPTAPAPPSDVEPNGHLRASPGPISAALRHDISVQSQVVWGAGGVGGAAGGAGGARYALHPPAPRPPPPAAHALRGSSSSSESVSSCGASPPPAPPAPPHLARPPRYNRVRTLYACLGESEGELSFEPNQIVEHVVPSGEPGWLRGVLAGRAGLVPENYVEPLP